MKRFKRVTLAVVLAILLSFSAGCTSGGKEQGVTLNGFELGHFDAATAEDGAMDSKLFYRNDLNVIGGDPDIEWVPEDRDSVYGGYYYQYTSGNVANGTNSYYKDADNKILDHKSTVTCLRSKDMNDWELCGAVDNGFSVYFEEDAWIKSHCWAPEVIYDANTAKYYMYFNALSYDNPDPMSDEKQYGNSNNNFYDTFYLCILESESPVGPFKLVESETHYDGLTYSQMNDEQKATYDRTGKLSNLNGKILTHKNPSANFTYDTGFEGGVFSVIDFSPFFDDDGTLYLTFVRHVSTGHNHNCMWMMRMKDMVTPDFESLTMTGQCNFEYVTDENVGDKATDRMDESAYTFHNCFCVPKTAAYGQDVKARLEAVVSNNTATIANEEGVNEIWDRNASGDWMKRGWEDEGSVNEGQFMWKIGDRYLYMYSPRGFGNQNYDARQSYSDGEVFGPYHKLPQMPGAVMSRSFGEYINQYMSGTGHHAMVETNGELFCVYYAHANPNSGETSATDGRMYAFDRVVEYNDAKYGMLLAGVGPTQTIQYKPSTFTGLKNVAGQATVTATNCDETTLKYLNDNFFVCHEYFADKEFVANGKTTITLKFDKAVTISALLIYNTLDYDCAFSKIDAVQFKLAKAPSWIDGKYADLRDCYIESLGFNSDYIDEDYRKIRTGAASVASFNEITVTEISVTVSAKITDVGNTIKVSDIVVLGK